MYHIFKLNDDVNRALKYFEKTVEFKDSVLNFKVNEQLIRQEFDFKIERQEVLKFINSELNILIACFLLK